MRIRKNIVLSLLFLMICLGFSIHAGNSAYTLNAEILSTTYTRTSVDAVSCVVTGNFTLNNNYTTLKVYFVLYPSTSPTGSAIATHTNTTSSYVNGTSGEVQVTETFTAYDYNAKNIGVYGASKIYLFMYVYNASISASNLLVSSSYDLDYWPTGGRYTRTTSTTAEEDSYSLGTYVLLGSAGIGVFVVMYIVFQRTGFIKSPNSKNQAPHARNTKGIPNRPGRKLI